MEFPNNMEIFCCAITKKNSDLNLTNFQEATNKVLKSEKDELYRKLMSTFEDRKKSGLSRDLTRKLRRRKRLRRQRHHKRTKSKNYDDQYRKIQMLIQL